MPALTQCAVLGVGGVRVRYAARPIVPSVQGIRWRRSIVIPQYNNNTGPEKLSQPTVAKLFTASIGQSLPSIDNLPNAGTCGRSTKQLDPVSKLKEEDRAESNPRLLRYVKVPRIPEPKLFVYRSI